VVGRLNAIETVGRIAAQITTARVLETGRRGIFGRDSLRNRLR
jgi:hypothetical protein